jgi:protein SCO1/2
MRVLAFLGIVVFVAVACGPSTQTYEANGIVVSVDPGQRQVRVAHQAIPEFMPAMTMNFDVAPQVKLEALSPGEPIRFTLERSASALRITVIERASGSNAAEPRAEGDLAPLRAERAPDFRLVDQDGRPFALSELRGRAVLLDFFFTGCTGPCPILTAAHVRLQRRLPATLREKVRFVSVSIDPQNDTPEKLRRYAKEQGADLSSWSFLTGARSTVDEVLRGYHVGRVRLPDQTWNHTIVTYLIDPKGLIRNHYLGLDVGSDRLLADLEEAAS